MTMDRPGPPWQGWRVFKPRIGARSSVVAGRARGVTFALAAMLTGCITLRVDAVPPAVRQDIGVNHLKDATARWQCEGGEELGVIPEGLFVASQDFILPKRKDVKDSPYDAYTYNRPGDWGFAQMSASYLVPKDRKASVFARFGVRVQTFQESKTSTKTDYVPATFNNPAYRETVTTTTTESKSDFAPVFADLCWPRSAALDATAAFQKLYRGATLTTEAPKGRHLVLGPCRSNLRPSGFASTLTNSITEKNRTSYGPGIMSGNYAVPDAWIADDGTVMLGRADGVRFRLTHPYSYGGTKGFLYERAQAPIYVNPTRGEEAVYLYMWQPEDAGPDPRPLGTTPSNSNYIVGCDLAEPAK